MFFPSGGGQQTTTKPMEFATGNGNQEHTIVSGSPAESIQHQHVGYGSSPPPANGLSSNESLMLNGMGRSTLDYMNPSLPITSPVKPSYYAGGQAAMYNYPSAGMHMEWLVRIDQDSFKTLHVCNVGWAARGGGGRDIMIMISSNLDWN